MQGLTPLLKAMEKHSAELRAARKKSCVQPAPAPSPDKAETPRGQDHTMQELVAQIEILSKEMETVAKEHPTVAILAAFAVGIAVGQLISRR